MNVQTEAQAQSDFLSALFRRSPAIAGATALHASSLQAYRGNLSASVERGLAAMHPSVLRLLGADDFDALAQRHLAAHPPQRGDWAQYGSDFSHWLRRVNPGGVVSALPFLPDLAALDAAMYRCEAAADVGLDAVSLQLLAGDAGQLRLVFHPAVALLDCEFAVLGLVGNGDANDEAPPLTPQTLLLYRRDWRAQVRVALPREAAFVRLCLGGATLHEAVQQANAISVQAPPFDFEAWLLPALQDGLMVRIVSA
jgi:hypothetical protein